MLGFCVGFFSLSVQNEVPFHFKSVVFVLNKYTSSPGAGFLNNRNWTKL